MRAISASLAAITLWLKLYSVYSFGFASMLSVLAGKIPSTITHSEYFRLGHMVTRTLVSFQVHLARRSRTFAWLMLYFCAHARKNRGDWRLRWGPFCRTAKIVLQGLLHLQSPVPRLDLGLNFLSKALEFYFDH